VQGAGDAGNEGLQVIHNDRQDFRQGDDAADLGQPGRTEIAVELPPRQTHDAPSCNPAPREVIMDSVGHTWYNIVFVVGLFVAYDCCGHFK